MSMSLTWAKGMGPPRRFVGWLVRRWICLRPALAAGRPGGADSTSSASIVEMSRVQHVLREMEVLGGETGGALCIPPDHRGREHGVLLKGTISQQR